MNVTITIGEDFKRQAKPLSKKYPSFTNDLIAFQKDLMKHPL